MSRSERVGQPRLSLLKQDSYFLFNDLGGLAQVALSRRRQGFKSPWGRQLKSDPATLAEARVLARRYQKKYVEPFQ